MRAHNPRLLAEALLYILLSEAITDGNKLTLPQMQGRLPSGMVTTTLLTFAIDDLRQRKFLNNSHDGFREEAFTISRNGYDYARYRLSLAGSAITEFSKSPDWILDDEMKGDDAPVVDETENPGLIPSNIGHVSQDLAEVVEAYEDFGELEEGSIPASDRIVKRSDNEDNWASAIAGAEELREALATANDHGELDDDEYEQKLSEVRALQIILDAPQVQWEVLDQLATNTVKYLASKFADNAIGLAATGLLGYLVTLLQGAF